MTTFETYWITGFNLGLEWARDEDEKVSAFILDLGVLRLLWLTYDEA